MPALNSIAADKLLRLIGTPNTPLLIDVREEPSGQLVPGAVQQPTALVEQWGRTFNGRSVVVIDEDGESAGQGVAAWLRSDGINAETLEGGHAGWRAAGLPLVSLDRLPRRDADGRTVWVTRARPKVDRIACPWLIRRFVDPNARFLFVPPAEALAVAERFGAAPFDIADESVFWSHRADRCTFDLMVAEFGLGGMPAIEHLAMIVRGADTARPDIVPEAAGLLAISLGLSRMHADDLDQLEAGMPIYDALYRWCRDARSETHDWTAHQPREARA